MTLNARAVLHATRRLLQDPERNSHVTWIWGGTYDDSVIVVYRWVHEPVLRAFHRNVVERGQLFRPVDDEILADIIANEIEEPGGVRFDVPSGIRDAVPSHLRPGLVWSI